MKQNFCVTLLKFYQDFFGQKNGNDTFEIQESDDTIDDVPRGLKQKIDKPKEKQEIVDGGGLPRKKEVKRPRKKKLIISSIYP